MRNSLTRNENHYSDVPVHNSNNGDIKNFMNHFWHMLDFPRYGEPADPEPKLEISENKKQVTVSAELPGVAEDDIDVQISSDGYLTISAEKRQENTNDDENNYFSEISYGTFSRTVPLPWELKFDDAKADFENGVLTVTVPKSSDEQGKKRKIAINRK